MTLPAFAAKRLRQLHGTTGLLHVRRAETTTTTTV